MDDTPLESADFIKHYRLEHEDLFRAENFEELLDTKIPLEDEFDSLFEGQ